VKPSSTLFPGSDDEYGADAGEKSAVAETGSIGGGRQFPSGGMGLT